MSISRLLIYLACGACLLVWGGIANAQTLDFDKALTESKSVIPDGGPGGQASWTPDAAKRISDRYVSHVEWQFEFAQRSWNWHYYSTILLFFVVLLIVAFGLRITYLQFKRDYGPRQTKGASPGVSSIDPVPATGRPEPAQPATGSASTMKLSPAGLEISSQIIGLFVLGFSLAFFYLYVKEVYPIQVLNLNQSDPQAASSKVKSSEASPAEPGKAKP